MNDTLVLNILKKTLEKYTNQTWEEIYNDLKNPEWDKERFEHEWQNFISKDIRTVWQELPIQAQIMAFYFSHMASSEYMLRILV